MKNIDGLSAFAFTSSFISSVLGEIVATNEAPFTAHWTGKVLDLEADSERDSAFAYVCNLKLSEKGKLSMWVCDSMIEAEAMYALIGYATYHDIKLEA
jgi:hypothetical protein